MRICVFCGSSVGARPEYAQAAQRLGALLAQRGIGLVYGGGGVGLMGIVADSVLEHGGDVTGIIPDALVQREVGHRALTQMEVVDTMHQRKARMADLSDAFIAMPGGYGTLEEFAEVLTWSQLGIQMKPCGLLNVEGYWDGLLEFFDHACEERFVHQQNRQLVLIASSPEEMLEQILAWKRPGHIEKWMNRAMR